MDSFQYTAEDRSRWEEISGHYFKAPIMNQDLITALQIIARGHQCKRALPAFMSQMIAKEALTAAGLDWVGSDVELSIANFVKGMKSLG